MEKENGVFFIKKVEAQSLMDAGGVQFPVSFHQDGLIHSIFDAGVSVKKKYMEQTDTRQFKRWFRGSEAVNADGKTPKRFYHGTPNGTFNAFRNWQYFTENKAYADRIPKPGGQQQRIQENGGKQEKHTRCICRRERCSIRETARSAKFLKINSMENGEMERRSC